MVYKILEPSGLRNATVEETTEIDARQKEWNDASATRKLAQIKSLRLERLIETDYLALSDVVLSDAWKDKRKSWRDIPQNFTTESQYHLEHNYL